MTSNNSSWAALIRLLAARGIVSCVLSAAVFILMAGCGSSAPPPTAVETAVVLVDTRSGEVYQASRMPSLPATNPKTGKPTLMSGMYCPACKKWHDIPPIEVVQRNPKAALCPKSHRPLDRTGPIPENAPRLP